MTPIIEKKAAIQKAFSAIGVKNGSSPPDSTSNTFGPLYEFFVADALRSAANKRYDVAKAALSDVVDFTKPKEGAGAVTLGTCEHFDLIGKRNNGSTTLDKTMLSNELTKRYGEKIANEIIDKASKPRAGAFSIDTVIKDIEG